MKQRGKWLALAVAWALALGGCTAPAPEVTQAPEPTPSPTPQAVETAEFALPCYPSGGFHPITGTNRLNLTLAPLLYRGLFALDREFNAQNDLCERYEVSEDGLVWTFWLKEDTFSDGAPLTSAEVASSLETARKSERFGERLSDIIKVTAREENTVTVTLARPNGALPSLLDVPVVRKTDDPLRPLGTGPYYLTGEEDLVLTAREGAQVPCETIPLRSVGTGDDLVYAFDAGVISLVDADLLGTNMLGYSGRMETADYPTTGLLYVGCRTDAGACAEAEVRQAVALAFDRETVVRRDLLGHAVASALPVHPYAGTYSAAGASGMDKDAAEALLDGAGWARNEEGRRVKKKAELTVRFLVNQENPYKVSAAETLARDLEELGVAVTLERLPWDDFMTALKKGAFDLYLGEVVLTADFDPSPLLEEDGSLNYGKYKNEDTEALLAAYCGAEGESRKSAGEALWEQLALEAPVIPICFKNGSLLTRWGQVKGVAPTQRDVFAGLEKWTVETG